ncbi:hypothetical protein ACIOUE_00910 [Streptomyces xanthochromogenes]|uniref:hypothetical protein n=1 Tax=Streptomyces xanthochromogenes TaxID=67384 RepID=UPI003819DA6F
MSKWDHSRNEAISVENTVDEIRALNAIAQRAEMSGNSARAEEAHKGINEELDVLRSLRGK